LLKELENDSDGSNQGVPALPVLSAKIRAEQEVQRYLAYSGKRIPLEVRSLLAKAPGLLDFWKGIGNVLFPYVAEAALGHLGCPPGSGVLENDFSGFANFLTRHRSTILTSTAEMVLFCKQNYDLIPNHIPKISKADINNHIPERLKDPVRQRQLQVLHPHELDNVDYDSDDHYASD
jgi:hypothetical protein